jgi:hypothetical protein
MERVIERGCGLDVHKKTVVACVRVPGGTGAREQHVRTFGTTTAELLALRDWLTGYGVTHVAMESTGGYWKPIFARRARRQQCGVPEAPTSTLARTRATKHRRRVRASARGDGSRFHAAGWATGPSRFWQRTGKIGGKHRLEMLTLEWRREIAQLAARPR